MNYVYVVRVDFTQIEVIERRPFEAGLFTDRYLKQESQCSETLGTFSTEEKALEYVRSIGTDLWEVEESDDERFEMGQKEDMTDWPLWIFKPPKYHNVFVNKVELPGLVIIHAILVIPLSVDGNPPVYDFSKHNQLTLCNDWRAMEFMP